MDRSSLLALGRTIAPAADRTGKYRTPRSFRLPRFDAPAAPPGSRPSGPATVTATVRVDGTHAVRGSHELSGPSEPAGATLGIPDLLSASPAGKAEPPRATTATVGAAAGVRSDKPVPSASRRGKANPFAASVEDDPAPRPIPQPAPAGVQEPRGAGHSAPARLPHWVEQLVLALVRPGNRRRGTRAVQTEMRFESVKVVRNDLSTADVEVIIGGGAAARRGQGLSPACRSRVLKLWWENGARHLRRLGHLLF